MTERREQTFIMKIKEIFRLTDGRTVLAGTAEDGELAILVPGKFMLSRDGREVAEIEVESELFHEGVRGASRLYAVGTSATLDISADDIATGEYILTGKMRMVGHRHLVGIDSPPNQFVPDRMTLGPRLPEGWDGDSWTSPDESAFFLRAWNKSTGRYAIGTGSAYEEARAALLREVNSGGRSVVIHVQEQVK
jgi:hypothetical protein